MNARCRCMSESVKRCRSQRANWWPEQYQVYRKLHPEDAPGKQEAANRAYRAKQDEAMKKANGRDLSDPFYGATWVDLGW